MLVLLVLCVEDLEGCVLCGEGGVVHEEEIYVAGVVDEEGLVAGGHEMACLLVGAITNLQVYPSAFHDHRNFGPLQSLSNISSAIIAPGISRTPIEVGGLDSHLWHSGLALEASADTIVDTLRFPPARVYAFEAIALVTVEALGVCSESFG
jgi:hypothetical protein